MARHGLIRGHSPAASGETVPRIAQRFPSPGNPSLDATAQGRLESPVSAVLRKSSAQSKRQSYGSDPVAAALPVSSPRQFATDAQLAAEMKLEEPLDRKSTRLNSSHQINSYAVFCLKKKKTTLHQPIYDGLPKTT